MQIRDIMRPGTPTILPTDTLGHARNLMVRSEVRHLPVLDDGKLVGILSERDLLRARAQAERGDDWWTIPVQAAMSAPAHSAAPEASLTQVAERMATDQLGAMPIVENDVLLGIVTTSDVLQAEVREDLAPSRASQLTAADAMTPFPVTILREASLRAAANKLKAHRIRHLPVVDASRTVIGMLSESDLRAAIGDPVTLLVCEERSPFIVDDAMMKNPTTVPYDRPLLELARAFSEQKAEAFPVVDGFGTLIGIVTYVDIVRVLVVSAA